MSLRQTRNRLTFETRFAKLESRSNTIRFLRNTNRKNLREMRMFSSLKVFMFLGIAFMFVGSTVYAQPESLEVYTSGGTAGYKIGDPVAVTFVVDPPQAVNLRIDATGINITSISGATAPYTIPGNYATDSRFGALTIRGIITASGAWIMAEWDRGANKDNLTAIAECLCLPTSALIYVSPPEPRGLSVGEAFWQRIWIEDVRDLAGWQMDIAFNPDVLEVVAISEGDFLESDSEYALFFSEQSPGKITIRQVRVREPGAPMSGVYGSGLLVGLQLRFLAFSEALLGLHNVRLSDSSGERLSYSVTLTPAVATYISGRVDVNQDGGVDILDLVVVASSIGAARPNLRADVNDDGIIDVLDLVAIVGSPSWWGEEFAFEELREPNAAAPVASALTLTPETIREWITLAHIKNDGSLLFERGIANLERLLAARVPSKTRLLLNYPNPFNPETWIPYQLSKSADVTVSIYSVNGRLIRTLALGHQSAGVYQIKSRAAYWDGRNEFGEHVASGLYFYMLTAGNFSATGKMLVRK